MMALKDLSRAERKRLLETARRSLVPKRAAERREIPRVEHGGLVPVSYAQQRLWFVSQTEGGSRAYHMPLGLELRGKVDVEALCRALDRIVERHEVLRTTFEEVDGEPRQRVHEAGPFPLLHEDLRESGDPLAEVRAQAVTEVSEAFDLETGPVIRGRLLRHGDEAYTLLVTVHHIASDGWSMGVFLRELGTLYSAFSRGASDPLPALPVQYADYALWQRSQAAAGKLEQQAQYWERTLAGAPAVVELPFDRPRPPQQDYAGSVVGMELGADVTARLQSLSRSAGATLFMTVLAGWMAVLARLSRQEDVVVGTPMANRGHAQIQDLIGFFVNALALRVGVEGGWTVRELLSRVKACAVEAQRHQDIPFEQVVERVQPERFPAHSPIFQLLFVWQNDEGGTLDLPGLEVRALQAAPHVVSTFDIVLSLHVRDRQIVGGLNYATSLFDETTVRRVIGYLQRMLTAMAADAEQEIGAIELLSSAERQQVLEVWNDTGREVAEGTLAELFEQQVARTPAKIAVQHGDTALSYRELDRRANRLAHYLRAQGVGAESRVGISLERGIDMVTCLLATLKAGGAYLPLDPGYPPERLQLMVEDARPVLLLVRGGHAKSWAEIESELPVIDLDRPERPWERLPSDALQHAGGRQRLGIVIYTSGSTGEPRGVLIEQGGVADLALKTNYVQLGPEDAVAHGANTAFDAATWEIWGTLLTGATLVCIDREDLLSPRSLGAIVERARVTALFLTTALFNQVAREAPEMFAQLDALLFGGERVDPDRVRDALLRGRPRRLLHLYGPTEATTYATWLEVDDVSEGRTVPIGRPMGNMQIYILDDWRQPVPVGVVGEIYIGGMGLARGYLNRARLTAERFLADPFAREGGARMYRTGDLGRWLTDGTIEFVGRDDFQVKVRGLRIELGEIEVRLQEVEGVREALVLAREDEPGDKRLVAYVVARDGEDPEGLDAAALSGRLRQVLPDYMVPVAYVRLEGLPLTPNGKVDRKALPAPDADAFAGTTFEAPQGELEQALAEIWGELLKVEPIGRHDDFFDLGGHSLLAMRTLSVMRRRLGVKISVNDFFTHSVLEELAAVVEGVEVSRQEVIPRVKRRGPMPLSYAQQRLWFLSQMEGGSRAYHIPFGMELHGKLDVEALRRALDRIVKRHEVLRTTFEQADGEPRQRVHEAAPFRLVEEDLREGADPLAELRAQTAAEAWEPFDLESGPVIRGRLLRHGDEAYTLLITMHHIASDGWSMGLFCRELGALYGAFSRGESDPLPALPLQYADYAQWQRSESMARQLEQEAQYWEGVLDGAPTVLELPFDRPRPAEQDYAGAAVRLELDAELSGRLKALSQREGTTLFMTVLAGWMAVLARLARQEDLVVGMPVANRGHSQVEKLIGFFVNTLALRVGVDGELTARELLERVKTLTLEAQQHQEMPFEQVVERLQPERSLAHSPIFQVVFVWQNNEGGAFGLPGLEVRSPEAATHVVSKFDLTLAMWEKGEQIAGAVEYATSLFDESTVQRIGGYLSRMLAAMAEDAEREIGAVELLSADERRQVLEVWNDTDREVEPGTLAERFERQAGRTPGAMAVRQGEVELSYRELDERANRLAHGLIAHGVEPGQLVAVALPRSVELVVALVAVLKAGAVYLPVDPEYPPERRALLFSDTQPVLLITRQEVWGELPDGLACWDWEQEAPGWEQLSTERPERSRDGSWGTASDAAYVIYTSGSTGTPKGVVVPHRAIVRVAVDNGFARLEPEDRMAFASNPAFDAAMLEVWGPLLSGAGVVVVDQETLLSPERFGKLLEEEGVTALWLTVGLFNQYADALSEVFAQMRYLITGGDVLDPRVIERVLRRGRPEHLLNGYGPTETAVFAATHEIESVAEGRSIPIGRPIANTQIYVLDERRQPVPVGVVGEIYIGGMGVGLGYLNREELTAERFVADPFAEESGARMYRTGDLGRWLPDGTIEFRGRDDFQVKVRGYRVELGEIEARLQEVEGVREVVVLAREDEPGDKRLVAYVVADEGEAPDAEALSGWLRQVLPEYMVPAAYVSLERLPVTRNGKVDRRALPAPEADAYAGARFEEPEGETERALAEIWAELLKAERISRHDNFFDLGGHSLLAVRLVNAARQRFDVEIAVRDLFTHPVLQDLADQIVDLRLRRFDASDLVDALGSLAAE